jgi:hypothetical protein
MIMDRLRWHKYRKTAKTRAKVAKTAGVCETLEGPVPYAPGDYLCIGVKGEQWPQQKARFESVMTRVDGPDAEGYSTYSKAALVEAAKMSAAFEARLENGTMISGKAGDYQVRDAGGTWVVDAGIFEASYEAA